VFITAVPITKLFAWGEGDSGGHVLRETTSRGLSGLVCPSRTSERGGEGYCVKEGGGGEGDCEKERALGLPLCHDDSGFIEHALANLEYNTAPSRIVFQHYDGDDVSICDEQQHHHQQG